MSCLKRLNSITAKGARYLFAGLLLAGLVGVGGVEPVLAESSTYTVSGSWLAPEGVTSVTAEVWGGGGGGGAGVGSTMGGSGGGGGGYARKAGIAVTPGVNYNFTVGNGGAGGMGGSGGSGGQSFFIDAGLVMANGGGAGAANGGSQGPGGVGGMGDFVYSGGGGAGGNSSFGAGGGSSAGSSVSGVPASGMTGGIAPAGGGSGGNGSNSGAGNPGILPGGGGGGAFKTIGLFGGDGGEGKVVITYHLPKPENVNITNFQPSSLYVSWDPASNERGYLIEASTAFNFAGAIIGAQATETYYALTGLTPNTTYHIRVGTLWTYATYYSDLRTVVTHIEQPVSIYFDAISTRAITVSVYAPEFTGLERGMSGVAISVPNGDYDVWGGTGNYWTQKRDFDPINGYNAPAAAAVGGKLYVMGGEYAGSFSDVLKEYDPVTNLWAVKAVMSNARYMLSAVALNGKIYAMGGYNTFGTLGANEAYDIASGIWTSITPMLEPRERHAAVALNGNIYVIGGNYLTQVKSTLYVYDPARDLWKQKEDFSPAVTGPAAGVINGRIYIAGGFEGVYSTNTVREYGPGSGWSDKAFMPTRRADPAYGVIGGKLYVVGGYNGPSYYNFTEAYDPATDSWARKAPAISTRASAASGVLGGKLYAVGGNNGSNLKTTEEYTAGVSREFTLLSPNTQHNFKAKVRNLNGVETGEVQAHAYTLAIATMPVGEVFPMVTDREVAVNWDNGSAAGSPNGPGASYQVQASTMANFTGEVKSYLVPEQTNFTFNWLEDKTTYYFRVQAYNSDNVTDYFWTVLGSTLTLPKPLEGAIISTMAWAEENFNWSRNMVRDSNGNLYAAYLKAYSGKYRVFLASSSDNGGSWISTTAPIDGSDGLHEQIYPALAIDSQNRLHMLWGQIGEPGPFYSSASALAQSWSAPIELPALEHGEGPFSIAVDKSDGLHAVWSGLDNVGPGNSRVRYSSRTALGGWTTPQNISDDGFSAEAPALAVDASNGVHVVIRRAVAGGTDNTTQIAYSSRSAADGWGAWGAVYTDGDGYRQSRPVLTIGSNGNLFAAWSSADSSHPDSQIKYAVSPPAGPWSTMGYAGLVPGAPQTNPAAAADALGNVYVLWHGSDTINESVNLKGGMYNGAVWDEIDDLTDETTGYQLYPALRWAGWRNNGGSMDVSWYSYDGISTTGTLRVMQGYDVPMSPGWSETVWQVPDGCGYAINVQKSGLGDFTSIQRGVNAVPLELSTTTCVVIRDAGTYAEQVNVAGISTGRGNESTSYRLLIMKDPDLGTPVIVPPIASTAAFYVRVDSVTIQGINIVPDRALLYGILASSGAVHVSSVNVISGGYINTAGIRISSYSAIEYSSVTVQSGKGIWLTGLRSEINRSSAVATGTGASALYLHGASSNSVSGSYFSGPAGYGVNLYSGSHFNTIAQSTIAANTATLYALYLENSSSNTIDGSYIYNTAGTGARFSFANGNYIYRSSVTGNAASGSALLLFGASSNMFSGSHIQAPSGYGVNFQFGSNYNTISFSTITADAGSQPALYISAAATNTVTNSYIQGSTAAAVSSVNGVTIIRGSVLRGIAPNGVGLSLAGSKGLFMTSSTVSGGAQGDAIYLAPGNSNKIELASNTVTGGKYGLNISALNAGGSLVVSSLTFQSLTAGATAINFLGGMFDVDMEAVNFESDSILVNVNAGGLVVGSDIFFPHPEGRWGALYENDPSGYVNWPVMEAVLIGPADGASDVSPAAALHAMVDGGNTAAQYHFQVDTAQNMESVAIEMPLYSFDQTVSQSFINTGSFSGQDWGISVSSDAYVYDSTATFVFYSAGTLLNANTVYYWRARTITPESGAYGQWTTTASFTTGKMAAPPPFVNNLAIANVSLSSPTTEGVSIGFTLRENNVVSSQTAGGANYNTADWVFIKFSTQAGADGTWNHATLTGGTVGAGATLAAASDNKGVFINHNQNAAYWTAAATVTWNYAADGVTSANARVKVFAISMVRVPSGQFVYNAGGIGGIDYNNYGGGPQANVTSISNIPTGAASGWPNGYNSFYIMRYELTQGQYADFLNTVHSSTAAVLYEEDVMYGHNMTYVLGNPYGLRYGAIDRFAAKNLLSTSDLWSFLSWAALRPMSEMEFEKAARDVGGDSRTYPWGSASPDTVTYSPPNEGGTAMRNFLNYNGTAGKVLDSGRYLSGDVYRTPEQTGASPYGIADLAGNVFEHVLNCSYVSLPDNGNGTVAWPAVWPPPDSTAKGLRGGYWETPAFGVPVSLRTGASWSSSSRFSSVGGRGVRTP